MTKIAVKGDAAACCCHSQVLLEPTAPPLATASNAIFLRWIHIVLECSETIDLLTRLFSNVIRRFSSFSAIASSLFLYSIILGCDSGASSTVICTRPTFRPFSSLRYLTCCRCRLRTKDVKTGIQIRTEKDICETSGLPAYNSRLHGINTLVPGDSSSKSGQTL